MSFAHPLLAVAAAASVALPILIHLLLRFRRRPAPWAAMRFLFEAYQKQRKKLRLQQILLLMTRCLLLLVAGIAIARPLSGGESGVTGPRDLYLLIDDSLSSQLRPTDDGATALERSITAAREMLRGMAPGDRVGVVTLSSPAQAFVLPATGDRAAVGSALEQITPTDAAADIEGALRLIRDEIDRAAVGRSEVLIFSELRAGAFGSGEPSEVFTGDRTPSVRFPELASVAVPNVQITGIEPERSLFLGAGERTTVRVSLRRFGGQVDLAQTSTVRIAYESEGDGLLDVGRASARWEPGQTETDVFVSVRSPADSTSMTALRATIDRDRLAGDDQRRIPLMVAESVKVGIVDRAGINADTTDPIRSGRWVSLALSPDRTSRLQPVSLDPSDVDIAALADLDAVFILRPDLLSAASWALIGEYVARGRSVAIFPPAGVDAHAWSVVATESLGLSGGIGAEKIEFPEARSVRPADASGAPLLRLLTAELDELTRPVRVFAALELTIPAGEGGAVLTLDDGSPWVARYASRRGSRGAGSVLVFASAPSLEWSTLPATPLMVPLVQELVRQSAGAGLRERVVEAGVASALPSDVRTLVSTTGGEEVAVMEGIPSAPLRMSGVYQSRGERAEALAPLIVVPSVMAGRTDPVSAAEASRWFEAAGLRAAEPEAGEASPRTGEADLGASLGVSGMLFLAALALAALETFLSRRFSPRTSGGGA